MIKKILFIALLICFGKVVNAQVWQWCVKVDKKVTGETNEFPQAFLWIPENCVKVRAVVFTQHNMTEEGMLEHPVFRRTMKDLGIAEVWVTPGFAATFDFTKDDGDVFKYMMKLLAGVSGYSELEQVPVIPLGHSAYASFPWNFAAWNPGKTLALVSFHGDAPLTKLTGNGMPNPDWGDRTIDGVPALFIMGEFEWWEERIKPGFDYVSKHPQAPITFFADAGHGHFDYSDAVIEYICLFIKKAAAQRLPQNRKIDKPNQLLPVKPQNGWLMDRWHKDSLPTAAAAPYKKYKGDKYSSSWVFDKEQADATENFYATARGKINQSIGYIQLGDTIKPTSNHAQFVLKFIPLSDGISFNLKAFYADTTKIKPAPFHPIANPVITRICGSVKKINDTTFQLSFYRMGFNNSKRSNDVWLLASGKADDQYKSAVQQAEIKIPLFNTKGMAQQIFFKPIGNQQRAAKRVKLEAVSNAGLPVSFYVKEGPAVIMDNEIKFTTIPPRARFPIKVTVVAWQYGINNEPFVQSAKPVENTFYIIK